MKARIKIIFKTTKNKLNFSYKDTCRSKKKKYKDTYISLLTNSPEFITIRVSVPHHCKTLKINKSITRLASAN